MGGLIDAQHVSSTVHVGTATGGQKACFDLTSPSRIKAYPNWPSPRGEKRSSVEPIQNNLQDE